MKIDCDPRLGSSVIRTVATSGAWIIRNAKIPDRTQFVDILIQNRIITGVGSVAETASAEEIDVGGRVVLPGLVDVHMHLDKAWLGTGVLNRTGTYEEAVRVMSAQKRAFTPEDIAARAFHVIRLAVANGTTAIRSHVDVDRVIGLTALHALLTLKRELARLVDLEVVPICRAEIVRSRMARRLIEEAIQGGVRVLGGTPRSAMQGWTHLKWIFEIASSHDLDVDLHVDEIDDPRHLMIRDVLELTERYGYEGRVTVSHLCSLGVISQERAKPIIQKLKALHVNVVTLPASNLFLQGRRDSRSPRRGLTRVKELLAAGVNVAVASDNVRDAFCPYGTANLVQAALLLAHAAQFAGPDDFAALARMITEYPSRIFWPPDGRALGAGQVADLIVLDTTTISDVILSQPCCLFVFKSGQLVVQTERKTIFDPTTDSKYESLAGRCASL